MSEIREAFNVWIAFVDRSRDAQGLLPLTNREVNLMREAYIAGAATIAPAPAAQEPVAWIVVDEPFHGTSGVEAGEWDVEFERKAIDELATANSPGRIPLYTATPAAEQQECGCCGQTLVCDPDCDCAEQPDTVPVHRELLQRIERHYQDGLSINPELEELRALLAGGRK